MTQHRVTVRIENAETGELVEETTIASAELVSWDFQYEEEDSLPFTPAIRIAPSHLKRVTLGMEYLRKDSEGLYAATTIRDTQ